MDTAKEYTMTTCPLCKKGTTRPDEEPHEIHGVKVVFHGTRCDACGEVTLSSEESRRIDRVVADGIADRGIRTGVELKLVRKAAGYRAADLAGVLDVTSKTVSRWERGEVAIPRAVAYVVADLLERPRKSRRRLEAMAQERPRARG